MEAGIYRKHRAFNRFNRWMKNGEWCIERRGRNNTPHIADSLNRTQYTRKPSIEEKGKSTGNEIIISNLFRRASMPLGQVLDIPALQSARPTK